MDEDGLMDEDGWVMTDGWMNDSVCGKWSFRVKGLRFQRIGPEGPIYFRDLSLYVFGVALPVHRTSICIACSEVLSINYSTTIHNLNSCTLLNCRLTLFQWLSATCYKFC